MTFKKLLNALGELAVRTVHLVFKLCGVVLTVFLHALITGRAHSEESKDSFYAPPSTACSRGSDITNDEYTNY